MNDNTMRLLDKITEVNGMKMVLEGEELLTVVGTVDAKYILVYTQSKNVMYEQKFDCETLKHIGTTLLGCRM